jgi:hypothetical protein
LIKKSVCRFSAGYPVKHSLTASDRTNSASTRKLSRTQAELDRRRCYRHFGAKNRSPRRKRILKRNG